MKYALVNFSINDKEKLIEYKKRTIYEYANDLPNDEITRINNYIEDNIQRTINDYFSIVVDNKMVGCLLLNKKDDGVLLDELYLEEDYRNKGIGSNIIKNIIRDNDIIYLWVYKKNIKAINLYKRLGFIVIEETETRYYMKYTK